jgi:hypothetical protein
MTSKAAVRDRLATRCEPSHQSCLVVVPADIVYAKAPQARLKSGDDKPRTRHLKYIPEQ